MPTAETEQQLARIRTLLPDLPVREVPMFGAVAVMVDGAMVVAVHKDGSLLVRVDPAEDAELLQRPHASRAEMGAGRSMGIGWLHVDAEGLENDDALEDWVEVALRFRLRR
ncbi:TfoX/Sxy family protein [Lysobacter korlensis]|uniref:TfoX/Sxy family protein n=1 Tax=Lysobacter korlensis TaxID=553636 RepID=A0ABV6RUZ1_9GAMM